MQLWSERFHSIAIGHSGHVSVSKIRNILAHDVDDQTSCLHARRIPKTVALPKRGYQNTFRNGKPCAVQKIAKQ